MNWQEIYKQRLMSGEQAVKKIKSNGRVVVGHAVSEPSYLLDKMVENYQAYENVEIVHMVAMGKAGYTKPEFAWHFRHNALFAGGATRDAVNCWRGDYTPCFFFEIPRLIRSAEFQVDVALVQVSPPDKHGYCSLGLSVDYTKSAVEVAQTVIAQVNKNMPRTMGDSFVHVSDIDVFVEHDMPVLELAPPKIGNVEERIGENCAKLINDGDVLQLGIGAIPDAVLLFLKEKKDLGIHSEMFSDGVAALVKAGVITNKKKKLKPGKLVVSFIMGTRKLYDFVDDNPMIEMQPVDYVNNPNVIAQNDYIVSINSCIQVDLMGQVVSETIGPLQISGVGGQVDFVRGTSLAEHGRSIIAMPATAGNGSISKIVPVIDEGSAVTTSRNDVDYIVTEYGIAHLRGKTLKERARALIAIAHPDFTSSLQKAYEQKYS